MMWGFNCSDLDDGVLTARLMDIRSMGRLFFPEKEKEAHRGYITDSTGRADGIKKPTF